MRKLLALVLLVSSFTYAQEETLHERTVIDRYVPNPTLYRYYRDPDYIVFTLDYDPCDKGVQGVVIELDDCSEWVIERTRNWFWGRREVYDWAPGEKVALEFEPGYWRDDVYLYNFARHRRYKVHRLGEGDTQTTHVLNRRRVASGVPPRELWNIVDIDEEGTVITVQIGNKTVQFEAALPGIFHDADWEKDLQLCVAKGDLQDYPYWIMPRVGSKQINHILVKIHQPSQQ